MSFKDGFKLGSDIGIRRREAALAEERDRRAAELHKQTLERGGLEIDSLRAAQDRENELRGIRTEMTDFVGGVDRKATNSNLDADFEQAYQATALGLQAPAMVGGSNMANQEALTVRRPVDVASPEYQTGLAGLGQRYALASGNMADFERITKAERDRIVAAQDADYALAVIKDPMGEAAVGARSFLNNKSRSLAIDPPDPKTGMSTIRIVRGDRTTPIDISPADLSKVAVGVRRLQRGDVGGLDIISSVNKELANAAAAEFNVDLDIAGKNNEVKKGNADFRLRQQQVDQTGQYYRDLGRARNAAEGQSAAAVDYENKINGVLEGYQAAMAAGPAGQKAAAIYAREYDQLRATASQRGLKVPPALSALAAAQKGEGGSKPVKIEDAGQAYLVDGQLRLTDGRGGYIAENGILPQERSTALARAGVPENLIPQLPWSQDGTSVGFRGRSYDVTDPNDMRQLVKDYRTLGANDRLVEESQKMPNGRAPSSGFGPRITYRPDPRAPSIYADEQDWIDYRVLQNQGR